MARLRARREGHAIARSLWRRKTNPATPPGRGPRCVGAWRVGFRTSRRTRRSPPRRCSCSPPSRRPISRRPRPRPQNSGNFARSRRPRRTNTARGVRPRWRRWRRRRRCARGGRAGGPEPKTRDGTRRASGGFFCVCSRPRRANASRSTIEGVERWTRAPDQPSRRPSPPRCDPCCWGRRPGPGPAGARGARRADFPDGGDREWWERSTFGSDEWALEEELRALDARAAPRLTVRDDADEEDVFHGAEIGGEIGTPGGPGDGPGRRGGGAGVDGNAGDAGNGPAALVEGAGVFREMLQLAPRAGPVSALRLATTAAGGGGGGGEPRVASARDPPRDPIRGVATAPSSSPPRRRSSSPPRLFARRPRRCFAATSRKYSPGTRRPIWRRWTTSRNSRRRSPGRPPRGSSTNVGTGRCTTRCRISSPPSPPSPRTRRRRRWRPPGGSGRGLDPGAAAAATTCSTRISTRFPAWAGPRAAQASRRRPSR